MVIKSSKKSVKVRKARVKAVPLSPVTMLYTPDAVYVALFEARGLMPAGDKREIISSLVKLAYIAAHSKFAKVID